MENQDKSKTIARILALKIIGEQNQAGLMPGITQELLKAGIITNSLDFTEWGQRLANLILIEENKSKFRTLLKQIEELEQNNIKK